RPPLVAPLFPYTTLFRSDLVGPAGFERADELGGRTRDDAHGRVLFEAGTRVGDVEVAHGHLADAVLGAEGGIADALHRQLLRVRSEEHTSELQSRFDLVC